MSSYVGFKSLVISGFVGPVYGPVDAWSSKATQILGWHFFTFITLSP